MSHYLLSSSGRTALWRLWGAVLISSCAFDAGEPIGRLVPTLSVALDLPEGRVVAGRWITAQDYAIELTRFDVVVAGFSVGLSESAAASRVAFDPANPPAGYGLCHGGHCHADDGRLVPYDEIAAELAGGDGEAEVSVTLMPVESTVSPAVDGVPVPLALGDCPDRCAVGAIRMVSATVDLERARIVGTVYDRRTGDGNRLSVDGFPISFEVPLGAAIASPVSGTFGADEAPVAQVDATLLVQQTLFDSVDFAALLSAVDGSAGEALLETLSAGLASSVMSATVTRR